MANNYQIRKLKSSNMTHPVFHLQKPSHAVEFTLRAAFPHTPASKQTPPPEELQKNVKKHLARVKDSVIWIDFNS